MRKSIFFVCCDPDRFKKEFKKNKVSETLIASDIKRKLQNRDINKKEPNKEILKFHISKRISNFIQSKKLEIMYYNNKEFSDEFIQKILKFDQGTAKKYNISVQVIVCNKEDLIRGSKFFENNIISLENDHG